MRFPLCTLVSLVVQTVSLKHEGHKSSPKRPKLWLAVVTVLFLTATAHPDNVAGRWGLRYQPIRVVNGAPVLFRVTTPAPARSLSGKWLDHEIAFDFDARQKAWFGLAGASLETKPGIYPIELQAETSSGQAITYKQGIQVQHRRYPRVTLTVPGRYTAPSPEQLRAIQQDKQLKAEVFKTLTPDREWQGSFQAPVKAEISGVFGVQRVFNGAVLSTHQGLDFRVPPATPVAAANRGTVLLARSLYFEGNCVVIDHGQGLLTLYLHLSEIGVKEGERVAKGQNIGLSGSTGRATGPHLHLAVRWQSVYLNPAGLLSLRLP
jgi:murein DD-endopeptidase MepM/ murein hydrolase activator NlpD